MKATKPIAGLIEAPRLEDAEVINKIASKSLELASQTVEKLEIATGKYDYIEFSDMMFEKLVANNLDTFRSAVVRCNFENAQLTGLSLPQGNFKDVSFKNCRLNLANLRSSTFERCLFIDCDLSEADFAMSKLQDIAFDTCKLTETEFSRCQCNRVEFNNCSLGFIKGISGLKNATVTELNLSELAPLMAVELGLKIAR